ncbi:small ribosomal subunit protein uS11m isoform X1 [Dipodomys merriami]|uniref:small ribosomal subunit protein uS11m isoform X1 n=1 Tax=Dipodomys merriami TaxID=94247 RepID=UPI003855BF8D
MQAVRRAGCALLRPWARAGGAGAGASARTAHAGAPDLPDAAAPSAGGSSIYPPVAGQESPLCWAGKKFEEIPIAHIKASYNNTQIQVVSATHVPLARTSCGTEGFRNAKKGTGIAAQTAGIAAAAKATVKGVTHVRVVVKGLGPGRWGEATPLLSRRAFGALRASTGHCPPERHVATREAEPET